jgi:DNA polymerase III delta prime subunit
MSYFSKLWVEKYRPRNLDELILSNENRDYFKNISDNIPHLLFCSPPGQGKTTLAKIIVNDILKCQYLYINASDENGVDSIRNKVITFAQTRSIDGGIKVVILDEADSLTGDSQRILRNVMEEYVDTTRFILTANYKHRIIEPLESRCQVFDLECSVDIFAERLLYICKSEKLSLGEDKTAIVKFIRDRYPDFRRAINDLQKASVTGQLVLPGVDNNETISIIINSLTNKKNIFDLRRTIIESESTFGGDYQRLLKSLFDAMYASPIKETCKKLCLLQISEHLYRDNFVADHEINFFSCILNLENIFYES